MSDFSSLQIRGDLITPSSPDYDSARQIWNGMIDKRPAAIARCAGVADVAAAVRFAAETGVPLSVRGGGHNVAGTALVDQGLVIDLTRMRGAYVDPVKRTIRAQAGMRWGDFDRETQMYGLATTGGIISTTGIAGLTLGGGFGWLMGRFGLSCDNVLSFEVITADGFLRTASSDENPDLYWALRGGSGNFGAVTSMLYQLHPVSQVLCGMILYPLPQGRDVIRNYRDIADQIPDELTVYTAAITTPEGFQALAVIPCYSGDDLESGARVIEPLRRFGSPVADTVGPMPYLAVQQMLDAAAPYGIHSYWKGNFVRELSDEVIGIFVDHCLQVSSPRTISLLEHCHGAVQRVAADATAIGLRGERFDYIVVSLWEGGNPDPHIKWTREFSDAMKPYSSGLAYVNGLSADDSGRIREAYGRNYDRLAQIKQRYDPDNLFRSNQNIRPAAAASA
jgi:FAD/FMN-containing dehydrogenase